MEAWKNPPPAWRAPIDKALADVPRGYEHQLVAARYLLRLSLKIFIQQGGAMAGVMVLATSAVELERVADGFAKAKPGDIVDMPEEAAECIDFGDWELLTLCFQEMAKRGYLPHQARRKMLRFAAALGCQLEGENNTLGELEALICDLPKMAEVVGKQPGAGATH